jgi:1-acyl-sn-glycerol-3-phosphate acyltransferase
MVQNNTEMCFEHQFPRVRKTHTVLEFCDPIDLDTLSKEDKKFLSAYVQKIIEEKYEANKKLV